MGEGWIKLHRKVKEHWLYQERPFDRYHAWDDIMLSVNHEQKQFLHGNKLLTVKPGQVVTSLRKLGERWGWNQEKVRRFLNLLVSDGMIDIRCDTTMTVITIENWSFYQSSDTEVCHDRDTTVTQTVTNKNVKNEKKDTLSSDIAAGEPDGADTPKKKKKPFPHDHRAYQSAEYMAKRIKKQTPGFPELHEGKWENTIQRWSEDIDKMFRIDGVDFDEFKQVLQFSQTEPFWQKNILSGKKLREKYGQLLVRMRSEE